MPIISNQAITNFLYWIRQKRWLLFTIVLGIILYLLPTPATMSELSRPADAYHTLIIVIMALVLIITGPVPLPAIAITILVLQVVFGIAQPDDVASNFMSDAVFFIMGSLMLAVSIVKQGLNSRLALGVIRLTGNKTWRITAGFIAISALLSSFVGAHTVTAMMMPVGLVLVRNTSSDAKKVAGLAALLLFSIAYGSAMGSIGTPSGGGRNVIMMGYWSKFGHGTVSYLEWMKYTYPILLLLVPLTVVILLFTFRPKQKVLDSAVRKLKVQVTREGNMQGGEFLAIAIFLGVFLGWVFLGHKIGLGIIALSGVFLYLAFGLVEWSDLNRNTNWGVILLFGAAISIGIQINTTGLGQWIGEGAVGAVVSVSGDTPLVRISVAVVLTAAMANLLSSAPTIGVMGPIVLNMGGDPIVMGLAAALASSFAYLTAAASSPCMIIHSSGLVKSGDFIKAGGKLIIMSIVVLLLVSQLLWPLY
ncbi:MAG: SLC13 family permease [Fidelibacterota bacterium]